VLRGTGDSEVSASKLLPESWLSPWRQIGPGEVFGEELAAVLMCAPGEEQPIDAGTP
jgi:hypothetical protein